ncbi:MAG: MTH938/NDUFAF3 family protein [bacterium]|nr:MTH938/NDUFAF3 family protein [bacterium]
MIDSYEFGRIVINGITYTHDVIIYPDRVNQNWWRKSGHLLQIDDLSEVLKESPDVLIIGTGAYGVMDVPNELLETIKANQVEVIVKPTNEACEDYNKLINTKKVIAALHLTC